MRGAVLSRQQLVRNKFPKSRNVKQRNQATSTKRHGKESTRQFSARLKPLDGSMADAAGPMYVVVNPAEYCVCGGPLQPKKNKAVTMSVLDVGGLATSASHVTPMSRSISLPERE